AAVRRAAGGWALARPQAQARATRAPATRAPATRAPATGLPAPRTLPPPRPKIRATADGGGAAANEPAARRGRACPGHLNYAGAALLYSGWRRASPAPAPAVYSRGACFRPKSALAEFGAYSMREIRTRDSAGDGTAMIAQTKSASSKSQF